MALSLFGQAYQRLYETLCGRHPSVRSWHFQWLALHPLYRDLRQVLPTLEGTVLDVGCGDKPYASWLSDRCTAHIGLDVVSGPKVDHVIREGERWPLDDESCDAVLCTQVLEHARDLDNVLREITRVLRRQGTVVATVPFLFGVHGAPQDYRRFTDAGLQMLFPPSSYQILQVSREGAVGSTIGILALHWVDAALDQTRKTRIVKALILPLFLVTCWIVNMLCVIVDALDRTQTSYGNVLVIARRR